MKINYKDLIENMHEGLYVVDANRKIFFWNKAAEGITGYGAGEVVGKSCMDNILIHIDQEGNSLCRGNCPLQATITDGQIREVEVFLHHKDGHRVPVQVASSPLRDESGRIVGAAELFRDMTDRAALRLKLEELEQLAFVDPLTQLANRRYTEQELRGRFSEMKRYGLSFGVMMVDIDHFKRFNDRFGHDVGDLVLKTVAKTLTGSVRPFDLFGRWGGEEFVGILRQVDSTQLKRVSNRCRVLVENTKIHAGGKDLRVTVSIGAVMAEPDMTPEGLIKQADQNLYRAKEKGRNCVVADGGVLERKTIAERDLVAIINQMFASHEETNECRITGLFRLPEPDADGCNWSIDFIKTGGTSKEFFLPLANQIIADLQRQYNIEE